MRVKIFLFFVFVTSLITAQVKAPKIYSPKEAFSFGEIKEGELLKFSFTIENRGDAALKIVKVRASCGCTAAEPEKKVLQPGDSTKIMVTFNSSHRSGLQRKHVYIYSNDPETPQLRLSFTAKVISSNVKAKLANGPKIFFPSTKYNFGTVKSGTIVTGKLRFKNSGNSDLRIVKVEPSAKYIHASTNTNVISPGASGELVIRFDSAKRTGKITRTIAVYSNDISKQYEIITLDINITPKDK